MTVNLEFKKTQKKVGIHSLTMYILQFMDSLFSMIFNKNKIIIIHNKIIMVEYIYLDAAERAQFAHQQFEYLIEQLNNNNNNNKKNKNFIFNNSKWIYSYKLINES